MKFRTLLYLIGIVFLVGCNGRTSRNNLDVGDKNDSIPLEVVNPTVNIYIENSGSMDGYVKGNTEFKGAIRDLLVLLKHYYGEDDKIKVFFINSQIRETDTKTDLAHFTQNINAYWKVKGEDTASSNLNNVFKMILDKTDKETISILFSDCIYSIKGKNAEGLLSDEKSLTKDAFLSRWRVDSLKLATTVVKMKSKFTGKYYDKDNKPFILNNEYRPYYICVIGNDNVMNDFNKKIPLGKDKIEGFENKYIISAGQTKTPYYSVLLSTDNVGRFKATRKESTKNYIHGIEDIKLKSRGNDDKFSFGIAVDMKNIYAEDDYLLNTDNYVLADNNFKVKEVKLIDKNNINASDWLRISEANPTHIVILEATGKAKSDVKISLKKQAPQWIEETNILDDSNIKSKPDKTFGIKYLINGITEAYQIIYPNDKNFFEIPILIKP